MFYLCNIVNEIDIIMNNVTVEIKTKPANKKRFLESKKYVKVQQLSKDADKKNYSLKEVFERGEKFLNDFYGTDLKLKY